MAQHKPEGWKSYHHQLIIRGSSASSKMPDKKSSARLEVVSENYTVISDTGFKTYKDAIMYTIKHMN